MFYAFFLLTCGGPFSRPSRGAARGRSTPCGSWTGTNNTASASAGPCGTARAGATPRRTSNTIAAEITSAFTSQSINQISRQIGRRFLLSIQISHPFVSSRVGRRFYCLYRFPPCHPFVSSRVGRRFYCLYRFPPCHPFVSSRVGRRFYCLYRFPPCHPFVSSRGRL